MFVGSISCINDHASTFLERNNSSSWIGMTHYNHINFHGQNIIDRINQCFPFFNEDCEAEKFITSALRRFSANSKESLVRVLFSKNKLAMVMSLRLGTFLMGRLMTSLK